MKGFSLYLEQKESYRKFIDIMSEYSDAFSVVYFQYRETERKRITVRIVEKKLKKDLIYSCHSNKWPGTETLNRLNHIYNLSFYKVNEDTCEILKKVHSLYSWDYPNYPMDLCFYKNGYGFFESSAHEEYNRIYTDDETLINELRKNGLINEDDNCDNITGSDLYFNEHIL